MDSVSKKTDFWKRKVGFYEIKWKIENFCFAFRDGGASFETQTLWLAGKMLTKWRLKLDQTLLDGEFHLILTIRMIPPQYIPRNRVWTHWKVFVRCTINDEEKEYFLEDFQYLFKLGESYQCRSIPIGRLLLTNFKPFEKDIFTIRCLVLYNDTYYQQNYGVAPVPLGLLSLSNDLSSKINCHESSDLKLKNNKMEIKVHKNILYYRNNVLRQMIENDCVDGVIHLENKGGFELGSIVRYLYSGNFEHFMREPTFVKLELVEFFDIKEIKNWFVMDKLFIESKYEMIDFTKYWTIRDFSRKPAIISRLIKKTGKNSLPFPISLLLHTAREQMSFYVSDLMDLLPPVIFMQVSIRKEMFTWINTTRLYRTQGHGHDFGSIPFASKAFIMSCLVDDTLRLRFQLRGCHNSRWYTQHDALLNQFPRTDVDFYKKLSLDMAHMLNEGKFSDFRINIKNSEWVAHMSILTARSKAFAQKSENCVTTLKKIQPHVFEKFIRYVYSGVFEISGLRDLMVLYDLANKHEMAVLVRNCTDRLKQMLTVETVDDIFEFADENDFESLKNIALEYVKKNATELSKDPVWKRLLTLDLSSRKRARRFLDNEGALEEKLKPFIKIE